MSAKLLEFMADTTAIAKMESNAVAAKVNALVRSSLASISKAKNDLTKIEDEIRRISDELSLKIVEKTEGDEVKRLNEEVEKLKEKRIDALVRKQDAEKSFEDYMDEQFAMFASKGLDKFRAYREMIVGCGKMTNRFGQEVELMRILPRDGDIEPVEYDDTAADRSVKSSYSYSARVGIAREQKRGKYNDAAMLIEESAASVDRSESVSFVKL